MSARGWTPLYDALVRAIEEHGAPNTFAASELAARYGARPPRMQARLHSREFTFRDGGYHYEVRRVCVDGRMWWAVEPRSDS